MIESLFIIPGLALHPAEFHRAADAIVIHNPGFKNEGSATSDPDFPENFTIEDIARFQVREISEQARIRGSETISILGFSMGGMVLSVMATKFRHLLPAHTRFIFLNTSPNLPENPVLTSNLLNVRKGENEQLADFLKRSLEPFFSDSFLLKNQSDFLEYVRHRTNPDYIMSVPSYLKQVNAILNWSGEKYFSQINPSESIFIFSDQDKVINARHADDIKRINANARIETLGGIGHMVHVESPALFTNLFKKSDSKCEPMLGGRP